eukprot:9493179-Pyramimonas_sp.AAC.1
MDNVFFNNIRSAFSCPPRSWRACFGQIPFRLCAFFWSFKFATWAGLHRAPRSRCAHLPADAGLGANGRASLGVVVQVQPYARIAVATPPGSHLIFLSDRVVALSPRLHHSR